MHCKCWNSQQFFIFVIQSTVMRVYLFIFLYAVFMSNCTHLPEADLFIYNAHIYTVDSAFTKADAMVVKNGKILATGSRSELEKAYTIQNQLDAEGQYIYPGFIDAHAHLVMYAKSLKEPDLVGTQSWEDILDRVSRFQTENTDTTGWIIGRGWDQNDWLEKEFPTNELLNERFPNRPVYLVRIDGHAAIANQKALDLAGVKPGDTVSGGQYLTDKGKLTGLLIDNAMDQVAAQIPGLTEEQLGEALQMAERNCFATGLTGIHECGLNHETVEQIEALQKAGSLKMRLYVLLSDVPKNYDFLSRRGIIQSDRMHVRGFKLYADGALGSRGACLLQDYSDKPGWKGFLLSNAAHFDSAAALIAKNNWQMCTHAIGDSGNRALLQVYARHLKGKNDRRWRIEHAQVVAPADFEYFGNYNIVPSVQPTHATSDMYWAGDRLGQERLKGAYAYQQLEQQNGWIPLGTDFPVEDISPFKTFYAAVARKDAEGFPAGGFQMENALSRQQALRGMTIWAARAAFEEQEKGSLEAGKFADFIILDRDIMTAPDQELLGTKVLKTFLNGELVYEGGK